MSTRDIDPTDPLLPSNDFAGSIESNDSNSVLSAENIASFARYNGWRYAANLEWLSGIGVNVASTELSSPVRWFIAGLVGVGVGLLENKQTDYASRKMDESYDSKGEEPTYTQSLTRTRELFALGASMYQGAGASVEINDSIGLPNTKLRRRIQAYSYAGAVAVWASPPTNELGQAIIDQAIEHPLRTAAFTLAGSIVGKFVIVDGLRNLRKRLQVK